MEYSNNPVLVPIHNVSLFLSNNIVRISLHSQDDRVLMDDITIKNLEIFSSSYE